MRTWLNRIGPLLAPVVIVADGHPPRAESPRAPDFFEGALLGNG